ncbi:MAG: DUF1015 domain-containing protein [Candidatus Zixiibacteriota bacterium]|nr:MAG: DUF1015 domain-containing protein [candidate division Zixibacteria bacterium]
MAVIRPFRGLRPKPEYASQVASPPYDVLSRAEARQIAAENPYTFLRVNRAELELDDSVDPYSPEVYARSRDNLQKLVREGIMIRDDKPCYYAYRLTMGEHTQLGVAVLCSVDDYEQGIIKKHEYTRPEKVDDRARHIMTVNAQVGPVLIAFRHNDPVMAVLHQVAATTPEVDFTADDGIRHELWVVADTDTVARLTEAVAAAPNLYIADGHHRSEAASEVRRRLREQNPNHTGRESYNFFLTVMFDERELQILPYNRVVTDLGELSTEEFLARVREKFDVATRAGDVAPDRPHHFGMYLDGQWYELTAKAELLDEAHAVRSIDSSILSELLLGPILGITDLRRDKRIDFVGGIRGTAELVRLVSSGRYRVAFSLYPTTVRQLMQVADAGEVMPPKSTWFEPKLRSGMVINLLEE